MSAEAMGDAFKRSPYKGGQLLVHLAIADVVNDVHDNRFWMKRSELAKKGRASRGTVDSTLAAMLRDGWLEVIAQGGGRGKATEYRYYLAGKRPNHEEVSGDTAQPPADTAQPDESSPLTIPREPNTSADHNEGITSTSVANGNATGAPAERAQKPDNAKAPKPRARNPVWDAIVEVFGEPGTTGEAAFYGGVVRDLKADGIEDADEVRRRALRARALYTNCSPKVLLTRWGSLGEHRPAPDAAPPSRSPWSQS